MAAPIGSRADLWKTSQAHSARPEKTVSRRRKMRKRERKGERKKNLNYDNTRSPFSAVFPRRGPRDPPSPIPPPVPCIRLRRPPCRSSCSLRVCVFHVPSNAKSLMSHNFVTTLAPLQREKDSAAGQRQRERKEREEKKPGENRRESRERFSPRSDREKRSIEDRYACISYVRTFVAVTASRVPTGVQEGEGVSRLKNREGREKGKTAKARRDRER